MSLVSVFKSNKVMLSLYYSPHRVRSKHIEVLNMHCQDIEHTRSFDMGSTSAVGPKCYKRTKTIFFKVL
jgi:hypothetical protein